MKPTVQPAQARICLKKFLSQNGMKQGDALSSLFLTFFLGICHQEGSRETGRTEIEWDTSASGLS
jgi:hypothetical protein